MHDLRTNWIPLREQKKREPYLIWEFLHAYFLKANIKNQTALSDENNKWTKRSTDKYHLTKGVQYYITIKVIYFETSLINSSLKQFIYIFNICLEYLLIYLYLILCIP